MKEKLRFFCMNISYFAAINSNDQKQIKTKFKHHEKCFEKRNEYAIIDLSHRNRVVIASISGLCVFPV